MEGVTGRATVQPGDKFTPADLKIPLFVSNVQNDKLETDIVDYIYTKTKEKVQLQKIKMKTKRGYNAYKIMVTKPMFHVQG